METGWVVVKLHGDRYLLTFTESYFDAESIVAIPFNTQAQYISVPRACLKYEDCTTESMPMSVSPERVIFAIHKFLVGLPQLVVEPKRYINEERYRKDGSIQEEAFNDQHLIVGRMCLVYWAYDPLNRTLYVCQ